MARHHKIAMYCYLLPGMSTMELVFNTLEHVLRDRVGENLMKHMCEKMLYALLSNQIALFNVVTSYP
jgi:hypothetical protein